MAELDVSKTSTTDFGSNMVYLGGASNYKPTPQPLEHSEGEVFVDFPKAAEYFGYYKRYGQLKKAIDTLWIYVVGKGYSADPLTKVKLDYIRGFGEDTFINILWNLGVTSMIVGDAFAEVIKAKAEDGEDRIINLKPISPERVRIVFGKNGLIKRYEVRNGSGKNETWEKFKPEEIFHISNDRIGDEQRGTSVIECCKWVIDAIEEARRDYRIVLHRNVVPVRIIEVDTDDKAKRQQFIQEYKSAIQRGEVLVIPKGTVAFSQDKIQIQDPLAWIQSLENYFYLAVGIPRVIASPDGLAEGASKVGYLVFEPIYTFRQTLLEADLWQQLGLKVRFNRPEGLSDMITTMKENEAKNTSQLKFQPKDMAVNMERE